MGHLIGHVLAEADLGLINAEPLEEQVNAGKEVAQGLVVNEARLDSFANLDLADNRLSRELSLTVEKGKLNVFDLGEAAVLLVALRVHKVLNLGHEELAHTEEAGAGGDLISVRLANRGRSEGHVVGVELEKLGKVEELALGGLGSQVAGEVAAGADGRLEHEVEGDGRRGLDTGGGVLHIVLGDQLAELLAVVVVDLGEDLLVLLDHRIVELDGLLALGLLLLLLGISLLLLLNLLATGLLVAT